MAGEIRIVIMLDRRLARVLLPVVLLASMSLELGSETLQLTTTYPSPSGVYNQLITVGNGNAHTLLARDNGFVGIRTGTVVPTSPLHVRGNTLISGTGVGALRGYLRIDNTNTGCGAVTTVTPNSVICPGAYATWNPGVYVEGWSYSNRGGAVRADLGGFQTTQVWGLNTVTGVAGWMTLTKDDTLVQAYCCPR